MHAWESIQTAVDFIEVHYAEPLEPEGLAEIAGLSPFYFQRLFSRLVKRPVREYVRLRRLAHACEALVDREQRILDVALACGFASHEALTRVFRDAYGLTPEQFRASPMMLNQFDKPDLMLQYVMPEENVPLVSDGLVLEMRRTQLEQPIRFLGVTGIVPIAGQLPVGEETGVDMPSEIWNRFHRQKHSLSEVAGGREIGVAYLGDAPEGSFTYFAGAEVAAGAQAEGFISWELPPREYMVCGFEAENFQQLVTVAINKAVKFTRRWLEEHELLQDMYSPELYYDSTPEGNYMELWIPICTQQ